MSALRFCSLQLRFLLEQNFMSRVKWKTASTDALSQSKTRVPDDVFLYSGLIMEDIVQVYCTVYIRRKL